MKALIQKRKVPAKRYRNRKIGPGWHMFQMAPWQIGEYRAVIECHVNGMGLSHMVRCALAHWISDLLRSRGVSIAQVLAMTPEQRRQFAEVGQALGDDLGRYGTGSRLYYAFYGSPA